MSTICLFDLDGTLTPARIDMPENVLSALKTLGEVADIGIVSGSPFNYIVEQSKDFLDWFDVPAVEVDGPGHGLSATRIMPCNGTQLYESTGDGYYQTYCADMIRELGPEAYRNIILACNQVHNMYLSGWYENDLPPITGNFLSYRNSLLNFCPPGRDANDEQRARFVEFDKKYGVRKTLLSSLYSAFDHADIEGVTCTLGGNTSIDIYPEEWDKTYCLKHLKGYNLITFVGDRCGPMGNDHTLYQALAPYSWEVKTTNETIDIIQNQLIPLALKSIN